MEETNEELPNFSLGIDLLASIESSQQARARPTKTKHAVELCMHLVFSACSDQKCLLREQLGE